VYKTASQIADQVLEKVAMPYKGLITATKALIKNLTGLNDVASRKLLKEQIKFLKKIEAEQKRVFKLPSFPKK
jgi:hypothetical protein